MKVEYGYQLKMSFNHILSLELVHYWHSKEMDYERHLPRNKLEMFEFGLSFK